MGGGEVIWDKTSLLCLSYLYKFLRLNLVFTKQKGWLSKKFIWLLEMKTPARPSRLLKSRAFIVLKPYLMNDNIAL